MDAKQSEDLHMTEMKEDETMKKMRAHNGSLLAYADSRDMLLMWLGSCGCMADGATTPLIMLALSRITNNLATNPSSLTLQRIKEVSFFHSFLTS